jgi:hypothetical protein
VRVLQFLSHPRITTLLGFCGLVDGFCHLVLPKIIEGHDSSFDLACYEANEAMLFASLVALQIAGTLNVLINECRTWKGKSRTHIESDARRLHPLS